MSMVATGFATCGHDRRGLTAYDLGQVLGGAAGGSLVGLLLGAVALAIAVETRGALVVAALAAVALAVLFAHPRARVCSRRLARSRQVPQRWARRPPGTAGTLYRLLLRPRLPTPT